MVEPKFDTYPKFTTSPGIANLRCLLNKASKANVFILLTSFDFPSIYAETPLEVAKAAKNPFYTEIYAYVCSVLHDKSPSAHFQEEFVKGLSSTTSGRIVWVVDPKTNLDAFEPYKQSLSILKFIFELHTFDSVLYPKDRLLDLQRNIEKIENVNVKKEYTLLGYVILGTAWTEDPELRKFYEDFQKWLEHTENNGQMIKWCATLKQSNFEKSRENRVRYIEVLKFIFREPYIESDYSSWFLEEN